MSLQNRLVSVQDIDEEETKTIKMTTPLRPKQPIPVLPCRLITPNKDVITWFQDGYITKKYKNGDSETWLPKEVSGVPCSFDMLTPNGNVHTTHYTTETDTVELEGEMVNFHMIDNGEDCDIMCWENECHCFDETNASYESYLEKSRCETLGFHVGCGDCPICGPELEYDDEEGCTNRRCYCEEDEY